MTNYELIFMFSTLNVNRKKKLYAPHKAILWISILDMIERNMIYNRIVEPSEELERRFKNNWDDLVDEAVKKHFKCNMVYPFFHMKSESIWTLLPRPNCVVRNEYSSLNILRQHFIGARIDDDLYNTLQKAESRRILRELLQKLYLNALE